MKKQFGSVCEFNYTELSSDEKKCFEDVLTVFFGEINSAYENLHLVIQLNNIQK